MLAQACATQRVLAAQEHLGTRQVQAQDHLAVATVWSNLERLLYGQHEDLDSFVSHLSEMLPSPATIPADRLAAMVQIHLQSASHMKITLRLLLPEKFEASSSDVTEALSTEHLADSLTPAAAVMVATLIDLQIFHLRRAQEVTAHMRMHAKARARASAKAS